MKIKGATAKVKNILNPKTMDIKMIYLESSKHKQNHSSKT